MQDQHSESKETSREDKIMNTIANTSILLMSTLMGGLSELMVNVTGELASGMTEALAGKKEAKEARKKVKQKLPEVNGKIMEMISSMRKDIYQQMEQKKKEIEPYLTDPLFDLGPQKVSSYNFGIPKLTEQLDDKTLAQYTYLLVSENATFVDLFGQLMEWLNKLPKTPEDNKNTADSLS